jgi:hypothetical protein
MSYRHGFRTGGVRVFGLDGSHESINLGVESDIGIGLNRGLFLVRREASLSEVVLVAIGRARLRFDVRACIRTCRNAGRDRSRGRISLVAVRRGESDVKVLLSAIRIHRQPVKPIWRGWEVLSRSKVGRLVAWHGHAHCWRLVRTSSSVNGHLLGRLAVRVSRCVHLRDVEARMCSVLPNTVWLRRSNHCHSSSVRSPDDFRNRCIDVVVRTGQQQDLRKSSDVLTR